MKRAEQRQPWLKGQSLAARATTRPIVILGLGQAAAGILMAYAVAQLAAPLLSGAPRAGLTGWALAFAAAALLRAWLGLLADGCSFEAGAGARRRLRTDYLVAAFRRGPHALGPRGVPVAMDQVDALDGYFGRWLPAAALAWAGPALVLLAVLAVDPEAAAIMLVGGLCVPLGMALAGVGAAAASQQQFAAMARLQQRFLDRTQGIATIVMANQADAEATRLRQSANDLARRTMRVLRVAFLSSAVLDAAAAVVLVILATRTGLAYQAGHADVVYAVFTLVLVAEFFAPLRTFAAAYQDRLHARTAAAALSDAPGDADGAPQPAPLPATPRTVSASGVTIAFEDVHFAWDAARGDVLRGLTFRVSAGETVVLVGPSGAGKSTVIELLLGFVRPGSGRITINGAPLDTLTSQALSRMTAWIGQRPVLFAGTIRDNIRFGRMDAPDDAIDDAARAAGLDAVAAHLPQGLDTMVGEGGYGLSGGQAQRVAIARAVLRQAPLLLLDEPTAHLDPATEADVLDSLRRLAVGRTVILAAHSSAAMAIAGRRIVLDGGREIAAQGAA